MKLLKLKNLCAACFLLATQFASAQLTDFTLTLTKTDETCTGNGKITFEIGNPTPNATIVFAVYLLPNTTTPVATTSALSIDGLAAGNYRVVATQTLGGDSNFEQQDIAINDLVVPLTYFLSGSSICNNGTITVAVNQGTAVSYEILSGPVTRPEQPSNVFTNLPAGEYVIRVHDACGDAVVQTFTLQNPPADFILSPLSPFQCPLADCNTILMATTLTAGSGSIITFPVTAVYTIHPPTGPDIVLTQVSGSGTGAGIDLEIGIPFYNDQPYTCDVKVTDACGNVTTSFGNVVNQKLEIIISSAADLCARNLKIEACNYVPPFTISFISTPPGFNPLLFNGAHPGPYGDIPIQYISNGPNQLPVGIYTVQITDGCGRIDQDSIEIEPDHEPGYVMLPQSCGFGQISMPGQNGSPVATVIITAAPVAFNHPLPYDVSFNIQSGMFVMAQLPTGTYTFTVISICGLTYEYTITIPPSGAQPVLISYIRGCDVGYASIRLAIQNNHLTQVIINSAPAGFANALPYDASVNIVGDGTFYMNGLPQGIYSIFLKDECGERTVTIDVPGYAILTDTVEVDENCGSFNVFVDYSVNETVPHTYWLQKFDPVANQWMHPITGVHYIEGVEPDALSSYELNNHAMNFNIASIGTFRVIRFHKIYGNGTAVLAGCVKNIKDFIFTGGPRIVDANILPCVSNPGQVVIVAEGIAPLSYYITTKDGQPLFVNNGSSNIFTGLTPGIYNFQVRDVCQNIVNRLFDFGSIPPPVIVQSVLCDGQNGQLSVEGFDFLSFQWWNAGNPNVILSTTGTLSFTPFSAGVNSGTYVVRIYSNQPGLCTDQTVSYTIPPSGGSPFAGNDATTDLCGASGSIDLFSLLTGNFSTSGNWQEITSSGMQIGHSWLPVGIPYGTYQFRYTVDGLCGTSDQAIVTIQYNPIPAMPIAASVTPVCSSGNIGLTASNIAGASYHWTGPNGFVSTEQNPVVANVSAVNGGVYSVTAHIGNCESPTATVTVEITPSPDFTILAGCAGNEYNVTVVPTNNSFDANTATYTWTGPDNYTASTNPIAITGGAKGIYTVTVAANDCETTKTIDVAGTLCALPSGISPNNDGDNETFDLTGFDVLRFKIYNRYGRMVFEQDDYTDQWHGQDFNGHELPDATYYYYIKLKTGEERTGWVYVTK
jgi:gliding motility-associated-like protein